MTRATWTARRLLLVVAAVLMMGFVPSPAAPQAEAVHRPPALPTTMAALGDSLTTATNACCWYGTHARSSWSTGTGWWNGVSSHAERIGHLSGRPPAVTFLAAPGARAADLPDQAERVPHGTGYATVLVGANDACRSSLDEMTPADDFRDSVASALETLTTRADHVFVASIPDIHQLHAVYERSWVARFVWNKAKICRTMLSSSANAEQRQHVRERVVDYNSALADACGSHANCRWDGGAVFAHPFTRSDVSPLDYFHPSRSGQARLASVTWQASWWAE